jgi:hypothetical protein
LRSTSAQERVQLSQKLSEAQAEVEVRHAKLRNSEREVSKSIAELRDLAAAEAHAEEQAARHSSSGALLDAAAIKAELRDERCHFAAESEAAAALIEEQLRLASDTKYRCESLRGQLDTTHKEQALSEVTDRCALVDARAKLDALHGPRMCLDGLSASSTAALRTPAATEPRAANESDASDQVPEIAAILLGGTEEKPRGLRKFWGEMSQTSTAKNLGQRLSLLSWRTDDEDDVTASDSLQEEDTTDDISSASSSCGPSQSDVFGPSEASPVVDPATSANPSAEVSQSLGAEACNPPVHEVSKDAAESLRAGLRKTLEQCQERVSGQLAELNAVHECLGQVGQLIDERSVQKEDLKLEQMEDSARRGQLRVEISARKRDAKSREALITSQIKEAFHVYRERALSIIDTVPHMKDRDDVLDIVDAQLKSIESAMLDDCDSAAGVQ